VAIVPIGEAAQARALTLSHELRKAGYRIELGYSGNMKRRLARADKAGAVAAVLIGEDELAKGVATVRDMKSGEQSEVALAQLVENLSRYR
jgi:histidyl-tRNA synthetase